MKAKLCTLGNILGNYIISLLEQERENCLIRIGKILSSVKLVAEIKSKTFHSVLNSVNSVCGILVLFSLVCGLFLPKWSRLITRFIFLFKHCSVAL